MVMSMMKAKEVQIFFIPRLLCDADAKMKYDLSKFSEYSIGDALKAISYFKGEMN